MERRIVEVALRVLSDSTFPLDCSKPEDVELLRQNAESQEREMQPQQLAHSVVWRYLNAAKEQSAT